MAKECVTCKYNECIHIDDDVSCFDCEHGYKDLDGRVVCKCRYCRYYCLFDGLGKTSYYVEDKTMEDSQIGPKNITARVALYCDECGCEIWEDEEYYYVDSSNICEACIDDHIAKCKKIAEVDDD